jgi:SagB-type dehydrogenase family enzyme
MGNRDLEAARRFHDLTKHSYTSVRSTPHLLDWENRPIPYKIYPQAPAVMLPRDLGLSPMPALEAISATVAAQTGIGIDLEVLTRILFCAGGLTRSRQVNGEEYHFRAAASAGALYPVEIYVATAEVEGLAPGLYHFSPADLKLRALRAGDFRANIAGASAGRRSLGEARAILILSTLFWRSAWKYRARAYRYCYWDIGTMLANLLAAANAEGLASEVVTAFVDRQLETLIGADGQREGVVCAVALGKTTPARAPAAAIDAIAHESLPLSPSEVSYPELVRLHRESQLASSDEVRSIAVEAAADPDSSAPPPSERGLRLGETILRRGATRRFSDEALPAADLREILAASDRQLACDFAPQCEAYLIVNAVEGMEPGAYFQARGADRLELIKHGDFRGNAGYLCLEQPIGAECSVLICYLANLERALAESGNRGYRDVHLEAGVRGGRAWLASFALGHGATGLTFYDDDTAGFFGAHANGKSPILMVAVGMLSESRS